MDRTTESRLPLYSLIGGAAAVVLAFGFFAGVVMAGGFGGNASASAEPGGDPGPAPTETAGPTGTVTPTATASPTQPSATPTSTPVPPTATPVPPTATPVPPTPTPTPEPTITYLDIFRAEGGSAHTNARTALPFRRIEASYNNSYRDCPDGDCVRGRVQVVAGIGPAGTGERLESSALVYNTFKAQSDDAELQANVKWNGTLAAVVSADAHAGVELTFTVYEVDGNRVVRTVPGMPYTVMEKEIGAALEGVDSLTLKDSRRVAIPMSLEKGKTYRLEMEITCRARAFFAGSATLCGFGNNGQGAEWTEMRIRFNP